MEPLGIYRNHNTVRGSIVVPFWGSYIESYTVIPKILLWSLWVFIETIIRNPLRKVGLFGYR